MSDYWTEMEPGLVDADWRKKIAALEQQLAEAKEHKVQLFDQCKVEQRRAESAEKQLQQVTTAKDALRESLEWHINELAAVTVGRSSHAECSEDYYFGSEDRGDNRCDLCKLKAEARRALAERHLASEKEERL